MRAVQVTRFGGPEVLSLTQVERPSPISTEVLVRVIAAGVNPVDCKTRRGEGVARWVGPPPFIPGWDVAGVVEVDWLRRHALQGWRHRVWDAPLSAASRRIRGVRNRSVAPIRSDSDQYQSDRGRRPSSRGAYRLAVPRGRGADRRRPDCARARGFRGSRPPGGSDRQVARRIRDRNRRPRRPRSVIRSECRCGSGPGWK